MQHRELGRSGLHTAPLVLGGNVFGWTADEAASFRVLDAFVAGGGNAIDTANVYSAWAPGHQGGESETVIGKWLQQRGRRDDVLILTKVGMKMGDGRQGLGKAYIKTAVEESLQRLQTDYIDLYQSHQDDEERAVTEPLEAYAELIKEGKVRAIGASNFSAARLRAALEASATQGLPRYETLQPEYNLYNAPGPGKRPAAPLPGARPGHHPVLRAGLGLPHGQVPHRGRPEQEHPRQQHRPQIPQRTGPRHSDCPRRRSGPPRRLLARPGGPGLDYGPPRPHGPHCLGHQP